MLVTERNFSFLATYILLSANTLNLNQSKMLLCGKELIGNSLGFVKKRKTLSYNFRTMSNILFMARISYLTTKSYNPPIEVERISYSVF